MPSMSDEARRRAEEAFAPVQEQNQRVSKVAQQEKAGRLRAFAEAACAIVEDALGPGVNVDPEDWDVREFPSHPDNYGAGHTEAWLELEGLIISVRADGHGKRPTKATVSLPGRTEAQWLTPGSFGEALAALSKKDGD